jgi:hypothetical protein
MAASTAEVSLPALAGKAPLARAARRRVISPQSGRALEILAHAIEYLTDEYTEHAATLSANDPEVQAIQLLMSVNRQVYFDCPLVPTFAERVYALFHHAD